MPNVKPYTPIPFKAKNKIHKKYIEFFDDGAGHTAHITKVDYFDNKNRLIIGYTLYVQWINNK